MSFQRFLRLDEIEACIEEVLNSEEIEDDDPIDIVQLPPNLDELTDCEDFDEDVLGDQDVPRDIPGEVELQYFSKSTEDEEPAMSQTTPTHVKRPRLEDSSQDHVRVASSNWKKMDAKYSKSYESNNCETYKNNLRDKFHNCEPYEIFEFFFDENVINTITTESVRYAQQKNHHGYSVSTDCIRKFIGILLFTGYHNLPQEKMYWSEDDDINLHIIRNCMPRNRYLETKRFLHFNNNDDIKNSSNDKSFKVKPIIDQSNDNFLKMNIFSKFLSTDEQMVRYFGGHFLKQFIRGKPIRFGLKQWIMACAETGYCYQMKLYQGKNPLKTVNKNQGLGENVIISMINLLEHPEDHEVYFDNFFSSFRLMAILSQMNVRATGTARANRLNKAPIKSDEIMKKQCRGSFDYRFDQQNEILALTWKDNNCVKVLSNHQTVHPMATVQRYNKTEKKKTDVQQPYAIAQYNKYMGGVDKLDWHINKYNIKIRGKKWYFRLFTNAIDISLYNAYVLYNLTHNKVPYLDFIRKVTRKYLNISSHLSDPKLIGRPSRSLKEHRIITDHVLERTLNGKQMRCVVCKKKSRKQCAGCNRAMHVNCFPLYHTSIL